MSTKTDDHTQIRKDFNAAVNMTPAALEEWLKTEESKSVGWTGDGTKSSSGGQESVGHDSDRKILKIKATKAADLTDADYEHMQKVTGYVHRHLKQKPNGGKEKIEDSRWRYSLMNWGHDPLQN